LQKRFGQFHKLVVTSRISAGERLERIDLGKMNLQLIANEENQDLGPVSKK
jgi:hypothetical protein